MIVYKISAIGTAKCCEKDIPSAMATIQTLLEETSAGEIVKVEVVEMTQEEYEALPDFAGF